MPSQTSSSQLLDWRELIKCSDEELAQFDIAAVNLACAMGLPQTEDINIPDCLKTLDRWAEAIYKITQGCPWFLDNPEKYDGSFNLFRIHVMFAVLQLHHGFHYRADRIGRPETEEARLRAEELFIHGLLQGKGGTCSSMPVLFIAVGRRLGYPLKLVKAESHYFVRWDSPEERFNIEVSGLKGFNCYPDDHYRSWPFPVSPQKEAGQCLLVSLTPRREMAAFMLERGCAWDTAGSYLDATHSFVWAKVLEPENLFYGAMCLKEMERWTDYINTILPIPHPKIGHQGPPKRRYPPEIIPLEVEQQIITLEVVQGVLEAPYSQHWWELLRQSSVDNWPENVPTRIFVSLKK